jgi:hypothetical protein
MPNDDQVVKFMPRAAVAAVLLAGCFPLVGTVAADPYQWPPYTPVLNYRFTNDYPNLKPPSAVLDDCSGVMGTVTSGWWCFRYGSNLNPKVTAAAWTPMLDRMNREFAYFRDVMGWPPDRRAKRGYFSAIYLFGSGLSTDRASNTDLGGWMGTIHHDGEAWPMVHISYYPVYSFDPACPFHDTAYQQGGVVHEGIHAILADMPGCRNAAWFHEGGNTWLQSTAEADRSRDYSRMGRLSAGAMLAPFMPIECYSGWLSDGSFGGPSAERGHGRYCSPRNLLGGTQYGESFAHFVSETVSPGSVAWIWQYCTNRVLEGLANAPGGLGEEQTRRLIREFRGRQAMCDFGKWSPAFKNLLGESWGTVIRPEHPAARADCAPWTATCYVATTNINGMLTPEARTLPGWSGANQVPLTVCGTGTVSVVFEPLGEHMSCQLVCRATNGSVVYGKPVSGGKCSLTLSEPVSNNVVIAVVCNTDYLYEGEVSRTRKYEYRLALDSGVTGTADIGAKWWK